MSKRKLDENDDDTYEGAESNARKIQHVIIQNSLDSDEEDEGVDFGNGEMYALNENDIEGQEDGGVGFDGDIQLTPFNIKEEMEEGHFDSDGMYHWKKEDKLARDNWLDNIDWIKVNSSMGHQDVEDDLRLPSPPPAFDSIEVYEQILPLMRPEETIAKTLTRLASTYNISSAERMKRIKAGLKPNNEEKEAKANVIRLTELADSILQNTGNMNVYQETYEYILNKVTEAVSKPSKLDEDNILDMYADDFDTKEKERLETQDPMGGGDGVSVVAVEVELESNDVMWEFKWTKDSTEVTGPYSSAQMSEWSKSDYFKNEVFVRKVGIESDFHSSRRIDFDLYL